MIISLTTSGEMYSLRCSQLFILGLYWAWRSKSGTDCPQM